MRILHISSARTWRGGEQQIAYLVEELEKMDIQNALLCPYGSKLAEYPFSQAVKKLTYKKSFFSNLYLPFRLRSIAREENIILIHAHDSHSHNYLWISYFFRIIGIPGVVQRRVDFPISRLSKLKYNHPGIKKIICVSKAVMRILQKCGVTDNKLTAIYSGVDLKTHFFRDIDYFKKKLSIPDGYHIVANLAAVAPHKDYLTFVNVAEEISHKSKLKVKFLIIGDEGGSFQTVREHIRKKRLTEYVYFSGYLDLARSHLSAIDVLLVTSQTEGLNTSILDAFAAGTPVVATNAGGIPEIVIHEQTGLLAPVGDAKKLAQELSRLLTDQDLKESISRRSKQFVQSFSKSNMAKAILQEYHKILEGEK